MRRPFRRSEESGLLAELGRQLADGFISADMVAPLIVVFISLERGEALAPYARVELDGDGTQALIVNRTGLGASRLEGSARVLAIGAHSRRKELLAGDRQKRWGRMADPTWRQGAASAERRATAQGAGGMSEREFIVRDSGHVTYEPRRVGWQLVGAAQPPDPPQPPTDERERAVLNLMLQDGGLLGEPVVSYSTGADGERFLHLDWPTVVEHSEDAEYARVLTLARLPLDRECPELARDAPDPELEAEIERLVAEDREQRAFVRRLAEAGAETLAVRRRAERRTRRKETPQPPRPKGPDPEVFVGEEGKDGWRWARLAAGSQRRRARWRP